MSQKQLIDQLVKKVQGYVVNSARYNIQTDVHVDIWTQLADNMSDEQTLPYLEGKPILRRSNLIKLVESMGVEELYDEDGWVDAVAEYIYQHQKDCQELWTAILSSQ
ncbi:MAG: hypothetical protein CTY12_00620 [Methylotenera sp.]|nr:MAG: hypothetical protein CTY12_00620 [Methylotenera sp.]